MLQTYVALTEQPVKGLRQHVQRGGANGTLRSPHDAMASQQERTAWLHGKKLEHAMTRLVQHWHALGGQAGWASWQAACVPHVLKELQTSQGEGPFLDYRGHPRREA